MHILACSEGVLILYLLFADDTIIFCIAEDELLHLRFLLRFEAVSGLKINPRKCEFTTIGDRAELVGILGCKLSYFPNCYLRLPLGAKWKVMSMWELVVELFSYLLLEAAFGSQMEGNVNVGAYS